MTEEAIRRPDWVFRQSAVLPYRDGPGGLEVLLITSRKGTSWVVPKGIVEPGLTPQQSAAKEAWEEAGVDGPVAATSLGSYRYKKWGGTCTVEVFPMRVREEAETWPEMGIRRRAWLAPDRASERVSKKRLRKIIRGLADVLGAGRTAGASVSPDDHRASPVGERGRVIYLLRHVKASPGDEALADIDRPLSAAGEQDLQKVRDHLEFVEIELDRILCSSALRARQTLSGIRCAIGADVPAVFDRRIYAQGQRGLLNRMRQLPDDVASIMIVGHNPAMQDLAVSLVRADETSKASLERFPAGALATLVWHGRHWSAIGPAACELHSLVVPGQL